MWYGTVRYVGTGDNRLAISRGDWSARVRAGGDDDLSDQKCASYAMFPLKRRLGLTD